MLLTPAEDKWSSYSLCSGQMAHDFFFFPNNVKLWDQRPGTWNSGQGSGAKILNDAGNIGPGDPSFSHCKVRELNTLL